jgi:moderate conductance mechanosensitive channel
MRSLRYLLIPVIVAIVCGANPGPAGAQLLPGLAPSASPRPTLFATAPVVVDGSTVLRIAAPASPSADAMPIEMRSFLIAGAIAQVLATDPDSGKTVYDPASFKVQLQKEGAEDVLVVTDARHQTPYPILTVTTDDARRANLTVADLAQQWQASLHSALAAALERRQPEAIHRNTEFIVWAAVALAILTLAGIVLFRFLRNRTAATTIAWIVPVLWLAAITYALLQFPQTVGYGQTVVRIASRVVLVWIAAFIADRLFAIAIRQAVHWWARIGVPPGAQGRSLLRVPTMSNALVGFCTVIIVVIAIIGTLSVLQVPVASVVTIGGIAAVAIGFAAQSLVRDCLGGLLVLFEDQYVEGDYVMIGDYNGIVEHLTLRVVQVRDSRGNLITIPHSSAIQVVNSSRTWSRVDYRVSVEVGADLRKAMDVLRDTLEALRIDERWRDTILEPVEWIGVEAMSRNGVVLRAVIRTEPLRQFDVRREINLRVYEALATAGIPLGNDPSAPFVTAPQASPDPS